MKKSKNQFVTSTAQLIKLCKAGHKHYTLVLGGGIAHSRKTITYIKKNNRFNIFNHIDNSSIILTESQIMDRERSNIGKAMGLNSFICEIK